MSNKKRRVDIERTSALMQKVKNSNFPKPKENKMASESTSYMDNRSDINQMKGTYAGLEREESSDPNVNFKRRMNEDLAKTVFEDKGFYSDAERKRQAGELGYHVTAHAGPLNPISNRIDQGPSKPEITTKPSTTTKPNPKEGYKRSRGLKAH